MVESAIDADLAALSQLHAEGFDRAWPQDEIATMMADRQVSLLVALPIGRGRRQAAGFVVCREAADEAEVLSIAVSRKLRGNGIARQLMEQCLRQLHADRVRKLFLEVSDRNQAAIALYRSLGFCEVGVRAAYYRDLRQAGATTDAANQTTIGGNALVMQLDIQ